MPGLSSGAGLVLPDPGAPARSRVPGAAPCVGLHVAPDTDTRPCAPAPAVVLDLRDRLAPPGPALPAVPVRPRAHRLARLQAADVQRAALLHARVLGRRRPPV